mmetsp:Transcript_16508/g.40669  ORF Transcript_16508/g.40669 Transcript_16508/m.40669 type:complete len:401 (-) Transcript_16508:304-1506(-)
MTNNAHPRMSALLLSSAICTSHVEVDNTAQRARVCVCVSDSLSRHKRHQQPPHRDTHKLNCCGHEKRKPISVTIRKVSSKERATTPSKAGDAIDAVPTPPGLLRHEVHQHALSDRIVAVHDRRPHDVDRTDEVPRLPYRLHEAHYHQERDPRVAREQADRWPGHAPCGRIGDVLCELGAQAHQGERADIDQQGRHRAELRLVLEEQREELYGHPAPQPHQDVAGDDDVGDGAARAQEPQAAAAAVLSVERLGGARAVAAVFPFKEGLFVLVAVDHHLALVLPEAHAVVDKDFLLPVISLYAFPARARVRDPPSERGLAFVPERPPVVEEEERDDREDHDADPHAEHDRQLWHRPGVPSPQEQTDARHRPGSVGQNRDDELVHQILRLAVLPKRVGVDGLQ